MEIRAYHVARTLEDAYQKLGEHKLNAILGGGAWLKYGGRRIDTIIDLSKLNLNWITSDENTITIGAQTTLRDLEVHPEIKALGNGFLSQGIGSILGINFRNGTTIGGTIMGKYPFSDVITPLLTLDVALRFYPEQTQTLDDFLSERSNLQRILTHIVIVKKSNGTGYFKKVATTITDFSILNIAIFKGNQTIISIGARPSKAVLSMEAMAYINKTENPEDEDFKKAAEIAANELTFHSDERGDATYRASLAKTYVYRGLKEVHLK